MCLCFCISPYWTARFIVQRLRLGLCIVISLVSVFLFPHCLSFVHGHIYLDWVCSMTHVCLVLKIVKKLIQTIQTILPMLPSQPYQQSQQSKPSQSYQPFGEVLYYILMFFLILLLVQISKKHSGRGSTSVECLFDICEHFNENVYAQKIIGLCYSLNNSTTALH